MPRRGDNIRKRKDGRWEARFFKDDNGSRSKSYCSVYGKTYQEAKEKRDHILKQGHQAKTAHDAVVFQDVLEAWQNSNRVRLKNSSTSRYQNLIDTHILPELGGKRMSQLSAPVINRYLAKKLERGRVDGTGGLSASYVRSITLIIGSALNYAVAENLCNPLQTPIVKPSLPKKELNILCEQKQSTLEQELLNNMNEEKLLIYLTLYTGLRIGEVCALRWEDISLDSKLIYVRQTISRVWDYENGKKCSRLIVGSPKTESSLRCIPICSKLYTVLSQFPYRKPRGYIMSSKNNGAFISPRTFEYQYKKILKVAHLELINYHALRHTFATRCIECGVDIKSLSEILGHANVSITLNTYVHSSIELKRLQLEKIV